LKYGLPPAGRQKPAGVTGGLTIKIIEHYQDRRYLPQPRRRVSYELVTGRNGKTSAENLRLG
jgi:hypothetical protein